MKRNYKLGLRTIKTAIAILICIVFSYLIGNRELIFFGGVASVICMQQTHSETLTAGTYRFIGTIIGGAAACINLFLGMYMPSYWQGMDMLILPILALICIYLCSIFNAEDSVSVTCIVLLNVGAHFHGHVELSEGLLYIGQRVIFTIVGIAIAFLVNRFIFPYKQPVESADEV